MAQLESDSQKLDPNFDHKHDPHLKNNLTLTFTLILTLQLYP